MVKIQINLSEEENRIVELYKLSNKLISKEEAIKRMISFFDAEIKSKYKIDK